MISWLAFLCSCFPARFQSRLRRLLFFIFWCYRTRCRLAILLIRGISIFSFDDCIRRIRPSGKPKPTLIASVSRVCRPDRPLRGLRRFKLNVDWAIYTTILGNSLSFLRKFITQLESNFYLLFYLFLLLHFLCYIFLY